MLSQEGHNVVLVEKDEKLVEQATEELDALVIAGNGANPKLLNEAGIKSSDLLVDPEHLPGERLSWLVVIRVVYRAPWRVYTTLITTSQESRSPGRCSGSTS